MESLSSYKTPYRGYKKTTKYVFVSFSTLQRRYINRANADCDDFQTYWFDDEEKAFIEFPVLTHHAHPYHVIVNALPKFAAHESSLSADQLELYTVMKRIHDSWDKRQKKALPPPRIPKRPRDEEDDDEDNDGPKRTRGSKKMKGKVEADGGRRVNKGKGKERENLDVVDVSSPTPQTRHPVRDHITPATTRTDKNDHHDKANVILSWIDGVTAAGPPENVRSDVIRSSHKVVRATFIDNWHDRGRPWHKLLEPYRFSSNSRALPSGVWDEEDLFSDLSGLSFSDLDVMSSFQLDTSEGSSTQLFRSERKWL